MSPSNKKHSKGKKAMPTFTQTKASPPVDTVTAPSLPTTELSPPTADNAPSPSHIAFRDFIKLADIDTINTFLTATVSTLESENIKLLWERAYKEGYENGRKVVLPVLQRVKTKLEEKLEEGIKRGKDLGREEG